MMMAWIWTNKTNVSMIFRNKQTPERVTICDFVCNILKYKVLRFDAKLFVPCSAAKAVPGLKKP
jgi:hypothetical protein